MAKNIHTIAGQLGAQLVADLPNTGGGAFGAARLARMVEKLRARLIPGECQRSRRTRASNRTQRSTWE
jgi:hypothetical protein